MGRINRRMLLYRRRLPLCRVVRFVSMHRLFLFFHHAERRFFILYLPSVLYRLLLFEFKMLMTFSLSVRDQSFDVMIHIDVMEKFYYYLFIILPAFFVYHHDFDLNYCFFLKSP